MKKILFFLAAISIFSTAIFAQEDFFLEEEPEEDISHDFSQAENFVDFIHSLDFVIQTEPGVYFNPESKLVSAPSPIIYPLTIGILWPNYTVFAVQPTLHFFAMEHLWYDGKALPAEIENRTTTTLSFMFTLPAVISIYMKKSRLQIMPGISLFARFGLLASGVKAEDSGYSGTAIGDVELINKWFWSDMHFLYLSAGFSWMFNVYGNLKVGPVLNAYIPFSMITANEGFQGAIFSAGLKLSL